MQSSLFRNCLLLCFTMFALAGCKSPDRTAPLQGLPVAAIETELHSLLQTWYPRIIDTIHGDTGLTLNTTGPYHPTRIKCWSRKPAVCGRPPGLHRRTLIIPCIKKRLTMDISSLLDVCGIRNMAAFTSTTFLIHPKRLILLSN